MTYATRADIETIYGGDELRSALNLAADAVLSAGDTARVDQALTETAGQIDAYVGVRYTLPLAIVPEMLKASAVDMTLYRLALRNGRPRDELRKRFEDAVAFLKALSEGKARLAGIDTPGAAIAGAGSGSSGGVAVVSGGRRFDRDTEGLT